MNIAQEKKVQEVDALTLKKGVANSCATATMLAKLPYNRQK
jgi:hypothetical protein